MTEFTIDDSSLSLTWSFSNGTTAIPEVGSAEFNLLLDALAPFGANVASMTFDEEAETIGDERLIIPVLKGRGRLRLGCAGFDLMVPELVEDGEEGLIALLTAFTSWLENTGIEAKQGTVRFGWQAFIRFNIGNIDDFLRKHLTGYQDIPSIISEGFVYNVDLQSTTSRVVFTRSQMPNFPDALYTEVAINYASPGDAEPFLRQLWEHWKQTFAVFNLRLNNIVR
jgi:hypothetical protein